jgi:hypothetical protein
MNYQTDVAKPGKLPAGVVEIPFEFKMEPNGASKKLFETYHGVYVNVQYCVRCEMRRGMLSKDLVKTVEFIVQYPVSLENIEISPRVAFIDCGYECVSKRSEFGQGNFLNGQRALLHLFRKK